LYFIGYLLATVQYNYRTHARLFGINCTPSVWQTKSLCDYDTEKTKENSSNKLKQQQVQTGAASTSIRSSNDNKYKQQQVQVMYI